MMGRAARSVSVIFLVALGMVLVVGCTATDVVAKKIEKYEGRNMNNVQEDERSVVKKYFKKEQYKNTVTGESPDLKAKVPTKRQSHRRHLKKQWSSSSSWSSSGRYRE
jgi:hypothetical protein